MKWFKHISDSLDDPFIFDLVSNFGGDGYLVFFGCLEVMAREFDHDSPETCTVSERFLTKKLQLSRQKLVKILKFCEKNKRIFSTFADGQITLNCPKLVDMCDEWTKKQLRSNSGVTPDSLRPFFLEEEEEEDKNTPPSPPNRPEPAEAPPPPAKTKGKTKKPARPKASLDGFQEFWAAYPRKRGKGQAEDTWRALKMGPLLLPVLLAGIERAKQDPQWLRDSGRYIPHPSTWLNARGWEDEPPDDPMRCTPDELASDLAAEEEGRRQMLAAVEIIRARQERGEWPRGPSLFEDDDQNGQEGPPNGAGGPLGY